MKIEGIYKIISPSGNIYIGQSINIFKRFKQYLTLGNNIKKQPILYNSFLKYGVENHKFEIITECGLGELDQLEILYKKFEILKGNKPLFCEIYDIGQGPRSKEVKDKISKANKGNNPFKNKTKEEIQTIINKRSQTYKGIPKSESFKNKLRKPIYQLDLKGNILDEFPSITEASLILNLDIGYISRCCKENHRTHGGFKFKYKL